MLEMVIDIPGVCFYNKNCRLFLCQLENAANYVFNTRLVVIYLLRGNKYKSL